MQVLGAVLGGNVDGVSTSVSLGVFGVDLGDGVEWLVDVSEVVDEESQGE